MSKEFFKAVPRERALELKLTKEVLERSVANIGDNARLAKVIKKAMNGEDIFIGAIGGSITDGTAASPWSNRYADRFLNWWKETFPNINIGYKNAGIGATDSVLAVHRVYEDLLKYEPDLVVIDFSVNDTVADMAEFYQTSYECLIRRIMQSPKAPAVMLVCMFGKGGWNKQDIHSEVGVHYELPIVSYRDANIDKDNQWIYTWEELSPDDIHPNNLGHEIISELLIHYVQCVIENLDSIGEEKAVLPAVLKSDTFMNGVLYTSKTLDAFDLGDFYVNDNAFWQFHDGWTVEGGDKPLTFKVNAKNILFYFVKDAKSGKAAHFTVSVDGEQLAEYDSEFPGGWGDYVKIQTVCFGDTEKEHIIEFKPIINGDKNRLTILGLLLS